MTTEQQKLALLEWAGWKRADVVGWISPVGKYRRHLPDLDSLDVIAELEGKLDAVQIDDYINHLMLIDFSDKPLLFTTATQRLEALVRTLGLWKE